MDLGANGIGKQVCWMDRKRTCWMDRKRTFTIDRKRTCTIDRKRTCLTGRIYDGLAGNLYLNSWTRKTLMADRKRRFLIDRKKSIMAGQEEFFIEQIHQSWHQEEIFKLCLPLRQCTNITPTVLTICLIIDIQT